MTFKKSYPELKPAKQEPPPEMSKETRTERRLRESSEKMDRLLSKLMELPEKDRPHLPCLTPLVDMLLPEEDDDNEDPKK